MVPKVCSAAQVYLGLYTDKTMVQDLTQPGVARCCKRGGGGLIRLSWPPGEVNSWSRISSGENNLLTEKETLNNFFGFCDISEKEPKQQNGRGSPTTSDPKGRVPNPGSSPLVLPHLWPPRHPRRLLHLHPQHLRPPHLQVPGRRVAQLWNEGWKVKMNYKMLSRKGPRSLISCENSINHEPQTIHCNVVPKPNRNYIWDPGPVRVVTLPICSKSSPWSLFSLKLPPLTFPISWIQFCKPPASSSSF